MSETTMLAGVERIGDPQYFNAYSPRASCPYSWCGDGTRGCQRPECEARAVGFCGRPLPGRPDVVCTRPIAHGENLTPCHALDTWKEAKHGYPRLAATEHATPEPVR